MRLIILLLLSDLIVGFLDTSSSSGIYLEGVNVSSDLCLSLIGQEVLEVIAELAAELGG